MPIWNKNECTGCGACYNICPKGAITIKCDELGFYKPFIDKDMCIDCGLCNKVCPLDKYKSQNLEQPKVLAFQNNDKEILFKCASGGVFAKLADYVIKQNGIVYGVIYDENMVVCHSRTDNLTDLEKMYSSKYVQSDTRNTFKQAKEDLEKGRLVLYSGTPCQIAGLKSYLQKDYENLITVDLVCHGVPSPLVFEKYKQEFMAKLPKTEKLLNINFRSKIEGWKIEELVTTTTTTTTTTHAKLDNFMRAFLHNLSLNKSCSQCQFNKLPRVADLTIADFWGVDDFDKSLNDAKGISIILINNTSGRFLLEHLPKECFLAEVPLSVAIKYNKNICRASIAHKNNIKFSKEVVGDKTLQYCIKKYDKKPLYKVLYHMLPKFIKNSIKEKFLKR